MTATQEPELPPIVIPSSSDADEERLVITPATAGAAATISVFHAQDEDGVSVEVPFEAIAAAFAYCTVTGVGMWDDTQHAARPRASRRLLSFREQPQSSNFLLVAVADLDTLRSRQVELRGNEIDELRTYLETHAVSGPAPQGSTRPQVRPLPRS